MKKRGDVDLKPKLEPINSSQLRDYTDERSTASDSVC